MDTLTHIVLGACIGEAIAGKQLGKKALLLGALAQNIPDIDFVTGFWLSTSNDLLAHRGFTHSFLFVVLFAPLLAWVSGLFKVSGMPFKRWLLFWGLQIFIHDFIDAFNAYGTGWFEPFSHYRVSFNTLFVADPLFAIWPAIALLVLLILNKKSNKRKLWAFSGLGLCTLYLLVSIGCKLFIDNKVTHGLRENKMAYNRYFTTPTPLNNLLWYIVAENDSGYYIGYRSVFDRAGSIDYHYTYRNESLLRQSANKEDLDRLLRFSQGWYAAGMQHDTLVFNDLRFGEIKGWGEPNPRFVFYYYMQFPGDNKMIVQRGRFTGWDMDAVKGFIKRIRGN